MFAAPYSLMALSLDSRHFNEKRHGKRPHDTRISGQLLAALLCPAYRKAAERERFEASAGRASRKAGESIPQHRRSRLKIGGFTLLAMAALCLAGVDAVVADSHGKRFIYEELTGEKHDTCEYAVQENGNGLTHTISYRDAVYTVTTDTNNDASACIVVNKPSGAEIGFYREKGKIVFKNGNRSESFDVEGIPWLQTPFPLSRFARSQKREVAFYMASLHDENGNEDNIEASVLKMTAKKTKRESIATGGGAFPSAKVIIALSGWKSMFWKITYWYRESDGMVVRYEDVRGGPGTPKTIGTLIKEVAQ